MTVSSAGKDRLDEFPEHQVVTEYATDDESQYVYRIGETLYQLLVPSDGEYECELDLFVWDKEEQDWFISPDAPNPARFMELFPDQLMEVML